MTKDIDGVRAEHDLQIWKGSLMAEIATIDAAYRAGHRAGSNTIGADDPITDDLESAWNASWPEKDREPSNAWLVRQLRKHRRATWNRSEDDEFEIALQALERRLAVQAIDSKGPTP